MIPKLLDDDEENQETQSIKSKLENDKGFFSKTTNEFQLGKLTAKEWVGSEILYRQDTETGQVMEKEIPFSVIAKTDCLVYRISKEGIHKLPKDILASLQDLTEEKYKFLKKRVLDILNNLKKVGKWDDFHEYYESKGAEV